MSSRNDRVLYESRTHFKVLAKPLFIQIVLLFVHWLILRFVPTHTSVEDFNKWGPLTLHGIVLLAELWFVVIPVIQWWTSTFKLTENRVIKEWGVLNRKSRGITLQHVTSVNSERSIIDRIFGAGTLVFLDASSNSPQTSKFWKKNQEGNGVRFTDVPHVKKVEELIENARFGSDSTD